HDGDFLLGGLGKHCSHRAAELFRDHRDRLRAGECLELLEIFVAPRLLPARHVPRSCQTTPPILPAHTMVENLVVFTCSRCAVGGTGYSVDASPGAAIWHRLHLSATLGGIE